VKKNPGKGERRSVRMRSLFVGWRGGSGGGGLVRIGAVCSSPPEKKNMKGGSVISDLMNGSGKGGSVVRVWKKNNPK